MVNYVTRVMIAVDLEDIIRAEIDRRETALESGRSTEEHTDRAWIEALEWVLKESVIKETT